MVSRFSYLIFILLSVLVFSCNSTKKTRAPRNLERIYNASSSSIHPKIKIYNDSDTSSLIVLQIFTKELLFNQANPEKKLQAEVKVIYNLYDLDDKQSLADSSSIWFKFEKNEEESEYTYSIPVKTAIGKTYFLEIISQDIKRNSTHYSFSRIDRMNDINKQDFLVYDKNTNELQINSYVKNSVPFSIRHYKYKHDSLNVYYYSNNFKAPKSPLIIDTIQDKFEMADTNWVCKLDSIKYLNFRNEGVYFFSTSDEFSDTSLKNRSGFALYNFGQDFPRVRTPDDLIRPLIYLDSIQINTENDSTGKYTKLAVDEFWLDRAKNIDKSRELLKIYYNRVMFANSYFTSHKEGWQTDRGMIFLVYGLPDYLFKSGIEERWIYNAQGMGAGITFTFNFIESPFSMNNFVLDREKLKYTGWEEAIEMWKEGEVFYFQK